MHDLMNSEFFFVQFLFDDLNEKIKEHNKRIEKENEEREREQRQQEQLYNNFNMNNYMNTLNNFDKL